MGNGLVARFAQIADERLVLDTYSGKTEFLLGTAASVCVRGMDC